MLDINLFREERGGDPEKIRESQRRRFAKVELVDEVIELDKAWRECQYQLDQLGKEFNKANKEVAAKKIAKEDATAEMQKVKDVDERKKQKTIEVEEKRKEVDLRLRLIGNIIHDSVPISDNEDNNAVVKKWGEERQDAKFSHVDLVQMCDLADLERGVATAGGRGYFLKGMGVLLNQAVINFGLAFLVKRGYTPLQVPFFMRKEVMAECAQLAQFDEELYKVTGEGDDKYLIATSEQPISTFHKGEWMDPKALPIRYAGYSSCFRKEAGSHGRDTLGIFRVHQFEKVEQFCITSPNGDESWEMHEEMLKNSEEFYQALGLPYRVVAIVSGALNDAAAKKYDLEAWFPGSKAYRELVSCSNCTDFQSRRLETRYGLVKKQSDLLKVYVHMLNSTLTATERTLCCILETNQTENGVIVPECLRPFMMDIDFIPFVNAAPGSKEVKPKKAKAAPEAPTANGAGGAPAATTKAAVPQGVSSPTQTVASSLWIGCPCWDCGRPSPSLSLKPPLDLSQSSDTVPLSASRQLKQPIQQKKSVNAPNGSIQTVASAPGSDGSKPPAISKMEVYVDPNSPASQAVRLFCLEANLGYALREVADSNLPPIAEQAVWLQPHCKLPLLQDEDLILSQSLTIMRYLATKHKSVLYPVESTQAAAKVEQVLEWDAATWRPLVSSIIQGAANAETAKPALRQLESWLKDSAGKYLTGRGLTIADIAVASSARDLEAAGTGYMFDEFPGVKQWWQGIKGRPHWAA